MRTLAAWSFLPAFLLTLTPAHAIVGAPIQDLARFPGVCKLMQGDRVGCTVTVTGPRTALTAAHCAAFVAKTFPENFTIDCGGTSFQVVDAIYDERYEPWIPCAIPALKLPHSGICNDFSRPAPDFGALVVDQDFGIRPIPLERDHDAALKLAERWREGKCWILGYGWGPDEKGAWTKGPLRGAVATWLDPMAIANRTRNATPEQASWVFVSGGTSLLSKAGSFVREGDSGGPVLCETPGGRLVQVAVHSWIEDREPDLPKPGQYHYGVSNYLGVSEPWFSEHYDPLVKKQLSWEFEQIEGTFQEGACYAAARSFCCAPGSKAVAWRGEYTALPDPSLFLDSSAHDGSDPVASEPAASAGLCAFHCPTAQHKPLKLGRVETDRGATESFACSSPGSFLSAPAPH
jgi:hypothetical protein